MKSSIRFALLLVATILVLVASWLLMRLGFGVAGIAPAREDIPARSDGKGADNYETAIQAPPDSRRPMTEQDAHTRPAQSAARPSGTSAIRGVVVFDSNDVPVAGATISVELLDPERDYFESFTGHEWSAHAADNGKFRVASLPDGLFEVRAAYGADRGVDRVHCDPNEPEDQIVEEAAWATSENEDSQNIDTAMAKAWCSDASRRVVAHGQQIHGGIGFTKDYVIQLFFRRQKRAELFWGDGDYHRERVAQMLEI